jgi:hypothetical protein
MVTALVNERFIDFNSDDVFIVNGRGASLPYIAQLLQQTGKHTIVVVDDDKAGRNYKKEIEQKIGGREPKVIVLKPDIRTLPIPVYNTEECEFEDLLDSKILLLAFNEAFSGTHTPISWNDFEVAQQKLHGYRKNCSWIDTMNYLLENKPELEKDGRNFSKAKLAEKTAEYIRDGKMPVPKFCKNVISEITELISRL